MAVVTTFSHKFLEEVVKAEHDVTTHDLKLMLMNAAFAFDPDTHATYANCSASEIAAGYGYTAGGETLTTVAVSIGTSQVEIDADNVNFTAAGGTIPETGSAIIYNDSHANKTVVMGIDFDADYVTTDTKVFQLNFSNGLAVIDNA